MLIAFLALAAAAPAIDESKLVDLTHPFDDKAVYWPTAMPFKWEKESWGRNAQGDWYTAGRYSASEHGGTHLDAPIHFAEGRQTVDQIPVEKLIGPAIVIDVREAVLKDRDYRLSLADITAWETMHGPIPAGSIVLVRTGWEKHWGDKRAYLGTDKAGDTANLHFPGISREAALMLGERKVDAIGLDTPSLDHGPSKDFAAHRAFAAAGVYGLENVANLNRLPPTGATVIALPMKIAGGTGGPARIIAVLP
jgi:kynurenine formamidase